MKKEFFLRYVGKPDIVARKDPVNYLSNYLTEIRMGGVETRDRKEVNLGVSSYGKQDVTITKNEFVIRSKGPNRLEIEADTLSEVEKGKKLILGITHTHNFRDYLLDEVPNAQEAHAH